tara:strand:- start:220 stop:378 length:159 start_codon:yes stop_codon:yes gene_type:complete
MLSKNRGMIVIVSSVAGKVGGQSMSGYSASKHASLAIWTVYVQKKAVTACKC